MPKTFVCVAMPALMMIPAFATPQGAERRSPAGVALSEMGRTDAAQLIVYGSVTLPDGSAPRQLVVIERVCQGVTRPSGFADSKGRFSFDLGVLDQQRGDGSHVANLASNQLAANAITLDQIKTCKVRAMLSGYHAANIPMYNGNSPNTQLGTIRLQPAGKDRNPARSETDASAPKNAQKAYDKGMDAAAKSKWQEAVDSFTKATALYPKYASAWLSLGILQAGSNNVEGARKSYAEAMAADGKFPLPHLQAAELEVMAAAWERVAEYANKAIQIEPDSFPRAYLLNATANLNLRRYDKVAESAAKGLELDPDHSFPELEYDLGIALIGKGDRAAAAGHLKIYLDFAPHGSNAGAATQQLALLQPAK
jgi:tetratricopeptide (TPR) repeat protein